MDWNRVGFSPLDACSEEPRKADRGVAVALQPVERSGRDKRIPEPCIFVVFGASGDLTKRKLLPALFHLRQVGLLPEEFAVVGVARRDLSETFVPEMKDGIVKGGGVAQTRCTRHGDRKSTRLNSSHQIISYAVFCLKKKKKKDHTF